MIANTITDKPQLKQFKQLNGLQNEFENYQIKANNIISQIYEEKFSSTPSLRYNPYFNFNNKKNLDTVNEDLNFFTYDVQTIPEYMQPLAKVVICFFYPKLHIFSDILYKFTWEEIQELTYDKNHILMKRFFDISYNPDIMTEQQVNLLKEFIELNKKSVEFLEWKPKANPTLHLCQEFVKITQEIIEKIICNTNKFVANPLKHKILPTKTDILLNRKFKKIIKKETKSIRIPSLSNIVNINFLNDTKDSQLKKRNLTKSTKLDEATDIIENKTTFKIKKRSRRSAQIISSNDNTSINLNKSFISDLNSQEEIKSRSRKISKRKSCLIKQKERLLTTPNFLSRPSIENFDNFDNIEKSEVPSISIKFMKSNSNSCTKSDSDLNNGSQESTTVGKYSLKNSFTNKKFNEKKNQAKNKHLPNIELTIDVNKSINNCAKLGKPKSCYGNVRGGKISSINNFL